MTRSPDDPITRWVMMAGAMANPEHLAKLKEEGVEAWNAWRAANWEMVPDLREAHLAEVHPTEADLNGADFSRVDLSGADLRGATLLGAHFNGAELNGANLTGAKFSGASLRSASLRGATLLAANLYKADLHAARLGGADFRMAYLCGANLTGAHLTGADLTGATIGYTTFANNDLSDARGLETLYHDGPSMIGIDTIYRSQGKIPHAFLRGAGVPDNFIAYIGSLTGKALEFYSCFISYSTKDQEFADRLYADLQNKGVRCWFAPHDMRGGRKAYEQIGGAIRTYERLLLILSSNSMDSEWVKTEISIAREREVKEKRRVLFPIRLVSIEDIRGWTCFDALIGKDSAREILEFHIPDFSDWENRKSYAEGLKNLLRDLKAEDSKAA